MNRIAAAVSLTVLLGAGLCDAARVEARPARLQPTRIYSVGDSITTAFDANLLLDNPSESWVNGYFGVFESLLGLENVISHNQRAAAAFGVASNVNGAANGARMDDMASQAAAGLASSPYYVTVELGGNDICRDTSAEVTTPVDYIFDFIDGAMVLDPGIWGLPGGLTPGSTVYTAAVPNIKRLYDVGKDETGLFGIDCETIWLATLIGFPCGSMLSPFNTEQNRLALQLINLQYNYLLAVVTNLLDANSPNLYWNFTWAPWAYQFQGDDISAIDCFHPSSQGQRILSAGTWATGPFAAF
jgi:lysophospholipase L1-like esterase